jgi:Lrp/AsnC family leucine-responsive transcriptional regulator
MEYQLDQIDRNILDLLVKNGKMGNKEVASAIGLSTSPTFERIKRLERTGYIKGYTIKLDKTKIGKGLKIFCQVSLKSHNLELIEEFEHKVVAFPEVAFCHHIAGDFDYSLFIEVANMDEYQEFVKQKLATIPNIAHVQSAFVMTTLKEA